MRRRTLATTVPSPAAGHGFTIVPSQDSAARLHSLKVRLTCSANAANRLFWAQLKDTNATVVFETGYSVNVTANAVVDFIISPQFNADTALQAPTVPAIGVPWVDMWLPAGWQIVASAANIDGSDQFSAIAYAAEYGEAYFDEDADLAAFAAAWRGRG